MRTLIFGAAICSVAFANFFPKTTQLNSYGASNATYTNASIPYSGIDMSCESCVRGGYDFCVFRTFPDNVTHGQFSNCTQWAITPELNSVLNVNETDRWMCSGAFKDQMQGLVSMCANEVDYSRDTETCGPYMIDIQSEDQYFVQQLVKLPLYKACTYRLHTKCSYPQIKWFSSVSTSQEYDIAYNTIDGLTPDQDGLFHLNATSQQGGNMMLKYDTTWSNNWRNSENTLAQANTTGANCTDHNMFITITRVAMHSNTTMVVEPEQNALPKSRVMKADDVKGADYITLIFSTKYSDAVAMLASVFTAGLFLASAAF